MASRLNPYVNFRGEAREAGEFYKGVFGGELTVSTFAGAGMPLENPAESDWIMHSQLESPSGFTLMISDTPSHMPHSTGGNISISLSGDDDAELSGYWDKLNTGGASVFQPLTAAPWGDKFGMLTDKYGVVWLVNISPKR